MAYFGLLDVAMIIHHGVVMVGYTVVLAQGNSASFLVNALYVSEVSNPIMHIRMVLKHLELRHTKAYEVSELSYILLFIYGRILLGTPVMIKTFMCVHNNMLIKMAGAGLLLQSYHYIYKMVGILKSRAREYSDRKRNGVKLQWFTALTAKQIELLGLNKVSHRSKQVTKIP